VSFMRITGLQPVIKPANQVPPVVTQTGSEMKPPVTNAPPNGHQTLPKVDTKELGMEREMIDLLKGQIGTKDTQIADLTGSNKTLTALNEKLTGVVVHQSDEIRNLLRLTGGKTELSEFVTRPVNEYATMDTKVGANGKQTAAKIATDADDSREGEGRPLAARSPVI